MAIDKKVMIEVSEVKGEVHNLMSDDGKFPSLYPHKEKQPGAGPVPQAVRARCS